MYNEFETHARKDKIKWIAVFTAIVLLFVGVISSLVIAIGNKPVEAKPDDSQTEANANATNDNPMVLLSMGRATVLAAPEIGSTVDTTESAYVSQTVTATITPTTVVDKYVTWSIAWAADTPLKSSNISDYIKITDESQGNLTATVNCYKAFKGSKAVLTCTTRQGNKTATIDVVYEGVPSSMTINSPSGVTKYNLGKDSVDLLYAGKTYSLNLALDNIFHDVGSNFNDFDVTVKGVGTVQWADYVVNPRGTGFNIDYSNIPTMTLDSMKDKLVSATVENGVLKIEAKDSYFNYYDTFTPNATYGDAYGTWSKHYYASVKDADGNNPYFLITVKHKTLGFSAQYKFFIGEEVSKVTTNKTTLTF